LLPDLLPVGHILCF